MNGNVVKHGGVPNGGQYLGNLPDHMAAIIDAGGPVVQRYHVKKNREEEFRDFGEELTNRSRPIVPAAGQQPGFPPIKNPPVGTTVAGTTAHVVRAGVASEGTDKANLFEDLRVVLGQPIEQPPADAMLAEALARDSERRAAAKFGGVKPQSSFEHDFRQITCGLIDEHNQKKTGSVDNIDYPKNLIGTDQNLFPITYRDLTLTLSFDREGEGHALIPLVHILNAEGEIQATLKPMSIPTYRNAMSEFLDSYRDQVDRVYRDIKKSSNPNQVPDALAIATDIVSSYMRKMARLNLAACRAKPQLPASNL